MAQELRMVSLQSRIWKKKNGGAMLMKKQNKLVSGRAHLKVAWGSSSEPREQPEESPGGPGRGTELGGDLLALLLVPGPPGLPPCPRHVPN